MPPPISALNVLFERFETARPSVFLSRARPSRLWLVGIIFDDGHGRGFFLEGGGTCSQGRAASLVHLNLELLVLNKVLHREGCLVCLKHNNMLACFVSFKYVPMSLYSKKCVQSFFSLLFVSHALTDGKPGVFAS